MSANSCMSQSSWILDSEATSYELRCFYITVYSCSLILNFRQLIGLLCLFLDVAIPLHVLNLEVDFPYRLSHMFLCFLWNQYLVFLAILVSPSHFLHLPVSCRTLVQLKGLGQVVKLISFINWNIFMFLPLLPLWLCGLLHVMPRFVFFWSVAQWTRSCLFFSSYSLVYMRSLGTIKLFSLIWLYGLEVEKTPNPSFSFKRVNHWLHLI